MATADVAKQHYRQKTVPFNTADGRQLNVINLRGEHAPTRGPVILVHGAGVRANIFRAPVSQTIVDALIFAGYDVWLENWRASIDFAPNLWTLDQAALYDHPAAVQTVLQQTGSRHIKAIIHCQGSTSFTMSAVAGLLPQVSVIVSNAVSLHPVVPSWSKVKLNVMLPPVKLMTQYLNPQWGLEAPTLPAKLINLLVKLTHHECQNPVCKQVSFTYGSGFPALWSHENLNTATHDWIKHEFAHVPLRFFSQMTRCVNDGHLLSVDNFPSLPANYVDQPPHTEARFALFAGQDNLCFLPQSQQNSYTYLQQFSDKHSLHVLPGYGHLDMFIGQHASRDVFPLMIGELEKTA